MDTDEHGWEGVDTNFTNLHERIGGIEFAQIREIRVNSSLRLGHAVG